MLITKLNRIIAPVLLLAVVGLASAPATLASDNNRAPELPAPCQYLRVPEGNEVAYHVYAAGVQVYRWSGASWDFDGPVASLFAEDNYRGLVGTHYRGPTWESNSGSTVVGMGALPCAVDPSAIPWLRLDAASTDGAGIFSRVTYIQRVNTTGGLRPTAPGSTVGEQRRVPYTAEYYFYRGTH